ncbi:hypothetical protein AB204_06495 [Xenorhabdus khoisanae]|uniref:Transposase n=1 Tax=Xenorhabdus khoisanae TaxID=880157 RepID=A0A0J5FUR4_9GAMM|nr:hypothetical protein AB204_06495 [Xenorhabdus khoisanae]
MTSNAIENDEQLKRHRQVFLSLSEMMAILILFHMSHYRAFKTFYLQHVKKYFHHDFQIWSVICEC